MAHGATFMFCADGVWDLEGCEFAVRSGRVEYIQVEPLRPVLVDLERLLCVGELIADMSRSLRLGVGLENKVDCEDARGGKLFWEDEIGSLGVLDYVIEFNPNIQGVLLRLVLVDLERSLCEFIVDM